jgi:hypothetical protein
MLQTIRLKTTVLRGDRLRENCDGYYNPQNLSLSAATHRVGCCDPLRGEIF